MASFGQQKSRVLASILIMAILLGVRGTVIAAPPEFDALLPEYQDAYAERFDGELIGYDIQIRFRPELNRITGEMTVTFPNFTGQPLNEIAFRLFPNAVYYGEGYLYIGSAAVDGQLVDPRYDDTRTALFVPLPEPLAPEDTVTIELAFRTVVPENSRGTYGIFSHHLATDSWVLADWHPIVAGWDDDLGWRTDPPTSQGDPTFADIGLYDLTVTLPQGYQVIATGIEQTVEALSSTTDQVSITSGPARDLTLLVSDTLIPTEGVAGETVVRVWANPDPDGQAAALWVLTESIAALNAWGERYGAYPAIELDLVATPVQQAVLGVSWSGLVMLSDTLLLVDTAWIERDPETARFAIVHEIGHQWWGNMIGANSNDHPFMVEGLTNALSIDIAQDLYGRDVALGMLEAQMAGRYRDALLRFGDDVVDQPVGAENPNGPGRAALAYGKGALGFLAMRLEMGDDAWFAAMRAFADQYLYTNAEPADLLAVLIAHAPPGVDVEALWIRWFEEAETTVEEIDALFAGMAQRLLGAA
jgi:aminopeptidase N